MNKGRIPGGGKIGDGEAILLLRVAFGLTISGAMTLI
jgi:hypothetical protein